MAAFRFILAVIGSSALLLTLREMPPDWHHRAILLRNYVLLVWVLSLMNLVYFQGALNSFGIRPRTLQGILGIPLSPFLHGDFNHLFGNTVGLILFGWLVMLQGVQDFFIVTLVVAIADGMGTWLVGQSFTNHIGASGLVYGYFGFLLLNGYLTQAPIPVMGTLVAGFLYRSLLQGIFPSAQNPRISWEGHMFGFLGGLMAALFMPTLRGVVPWEWGG